MRSSSRLVAPGLLLTALVLAPPPSGAAQSPDETPAATPAAPSATPPRSGAPPIAITAPPLGVARHPGSVELRWRDEAPVPAARVELRDAAGDVRASGALAAGSTLVLELPRPRGSADFTVHLPELYDEGAPLTLRGIPGWLTVLPPVIAIAFALLFRQVVPALLAGVWVGAWIVFGGPLVGLLRTLDHYVVRAMADTDHVAILVFSLLLAGMVGVVSRAGGTIGLVEAMRPYATDSRRGQLVTWLLGIAVFFDDYANTLLVGNTMRPVTDRLKISREKLAYVVDSTAAPVASVALISTWIGYEVSLIADSLSELGSDLDAYSVFVESLLYRFYPLLALAFGLMIAASMRDLGPMLKAERRARGGKLLADDAVPLADFDNEGLQPIAGKPRNWSNAVVPVAVVLLITFTALWLTGRASLSADGNPQGSASLFSLGLRGVGSVFGAGNSFHSLLYGSFGGCLMALALAIGRRILTLGESLTAWLGGVKSMTGAVVILVLAWSVSAVCNELHTADYLVALLSDTLDPRLLPMLVFVLAAVTSFSTGTSWGTMGILIPLAVPTAYGVAQAAGFDPAEAHRILLGAVSSVLAGAIFGDHCSPISDTTVLSSMASGCDHVDHVRTQLPYALLVASVAVILGDLPSAYGVPPLLCLVASALLLGGVLWMFGKRADEQPG